MTREEQIRQAGIEYTIKNRPGGGAFSKEIDEMNRNYAFEEGAKWADANPNLYNDEKYHTVKVSCLDELNRKAALYNTFIEKACEWLENELFEDVAEPNPYYYNDVKSKTYDFLKDFIAEFRKAMQNE